MMEEMVAVLDTKNLPETLYDNLKLVERRVRVGAFHHARILAVAHTQVVFGPLVATVYAQAVRLRDGVAKGL